MRPKVRPSYAQKKPRLHGNLQLLSKTARNLVTKKMSRPHLHMITNSFRFFIFLSLIRKRVVKESPGSKHGQKDA